MKTLIKASVLTMILLLWQVGVAQAAVRCETQYGGGETCVRTGELQIDKEVWNPETEKFVDNLGLSDYRFSPEEEIVFKFRIKNVGDETFGEVKVEDSLPSILSLTSGDLNFHFHDLHAGDVQEFEIKTRVDQASDFPSGKSLICQVNAVEAWSNDERDKDTAQFCVERNVLGVTTLPKTGIVYGLGLLLFSSLAGLAGLFLAKAR